VIGPWGAVSLVAWKDLRLLARRPLDAFFVFFFPALFAAFFAQVVSGGATRPIPLAVVDEDGGLAARALAARLLADEGVAAVQRSRDEAEASVKRGQAAAYVLLPAGLGPRSRIDVVVDPARRGEGGLLRGLVLRHSFELAVAGSPLDVGFSVRETPIQGGLVRAPTPVGVTLPQGLAWGLIACAATFGSSLAAERTRGTLLRLRAASLGAGHVLAAKGLACFVAAHLVSALLIVLGVSLFGLRPTSWALLACAVTSAATCFVGLMMLVATLGHTEEAANRAGWALLLVLAMLGGAMVPSYLSPAWLEVLGQASPVRWAIVAFEGAMWRGLELRDLLTPCGLLIGTGCATFGLGVALFRWR
jgi:ABC-2 type transport system permease protein